MPQIEFNEEDAQKLLTVLRDSARRMGLSSADEDAILYANSSIDNPAELKEQQRSMLYLDYLISYIAGNSAPNYNRTLFELNGELEQESQKIETVYVEAPEGTGTLAAGENIVLRDLLFSREAADTFLKEMTQIRNLIVEHNLPEPPDQWPEIDR
jgi:flagellar hook-basal body complex protein FliE